MRMVKLRMNEDHKYLLIKNPVDNNDNRKAVAVKLKWTMRIVDRIIFGYKEFGKSSFCRANRGRQPRNTIDSAVKQQIIDLYFNDYRDTNIIHFCEIVSTDLSQSIIDITINRWLRKMERQEFCRQFLLRVF